MMQTFEFKPGPIARTVRVEVDGIGAAFHDGKGALRARVEFSAARHVRFAELSGRDMVTRWFDVEHGTGRFRIQCNSSALNEAGQRDLAQYRAAIRAILSGVAARSPEVQVELGTGKGTRIAMFSMGAAALLFAVGVPVVAMATGVASSKLLSALLPCLLMGFIGAVLMDRFRPWVPAATVPPAVLRDALAVMDAPKA
ncbi:MAG: hypothetical protein R3F49_18365 [Planctomycetota bacterium]